MRNFGCFNIWNSFPFEFLRYFCDIKQVSIQASFSFHALIVNISNSPPSKYRMFCSLSLFCLLELPRYIFLIINNAYTDKVLLHTSFALYDVKLLFLGLLCFAFVRNSFVFPCLFLCF